MTDIQKLRIKLGDTQDSFAQRFDITARAVQKWEAGGNISKTKLRKLKELAALFPEEEFVFEVSDASRQVELLGDNSQYVENIEKYDGRVQSRQMCNEQNLARLKQENTDLRAQIEQLKSQLADKERIIKLLEDR